MTSKRLLDESAGGVRVSSAAVQAGNVALTGHCIRYGGGVTAMDCGITSARRKGPMTVDGFDTKMLDKGSLQDPGKANPLGGNHFASGREKHHNKKKMGCAGEEDEREVPPAVVLKRGSPTHRQTLNGQRQENHVHLECVALLRRSQEPRCRPPSRVADPSPDELHASSHIPVPRNRNPSGHADKEVMAATVLSTLSTSPLVLNASSGASGSVPEAASRGWKESLSASYSSSTSGNWSWDASDQSVPSTPSPPLSNDVIKSFLLSSQGEDSIEEAESTHFPFEDPIPRKRKNSMKVMFKCLWKNCDKVLSTSSGIQRHIRTMHLGRNGDSDLSDGEEDFYYSEIEVNVDTLSEGLSNLTPTSPTTAGPPPVFPLASDVPRSEPAHMSPLSQSAPSTLCHIRTDHAYQATAPVNIPSVSSELPHSQSAISVSWQSPPVIFKGPPGAVTHIRTVSNGEKRQPATHTPIGKTHATNMSTPKPTTGTRKPRGEAKKCRKVYGMEKKDLWCTACRWKKACQRFTD
ncbi:zinc finger protein 704 isoform X2 [Electrophorus electricus]|uniref:C2H2-type domain-containing protein n=1 Tax=Electrophorus electricus TaxID=8005 RepID=A0A4W4HNY5_ELEEL|nr:zinc finger protein 704 isoform X2 [Electrophorus electricus]